MNLNIEDFIIPLHDKKWVVDSIKNYRLKELEADYNNDLNNTDYLEEKAELIESFTDYDGSIILGKPTTPSDGYSSLMLGLKSDDYLDDQSLLEYVTQKYWKVLEDKGLIDLRLMESFIGIMDLEKEQQKFMSEVIAKSLYNEDADNVSSTADCKKVLAKLYGSSKMKRVSKQKWFDIEYRLFHNDDDEEFSIVSYKGKLISHYQMNFAEE